MHQWHVISLLIHGFLPVTARLLIAFGTAFYAIIVGNFIVAVVTDPELQIRRSNRDNSEIIFLISQRKHML